MHNKIKYAAIDNRGITIEKQQNNQNILQSFNSLLVFNSHPNFLPAFE
jgi:hypothetical protein